MENERGTSIKVFSSAINRIFLSFNYWYKFVTVVILAFISPYILTFIVNAATRLSPDILETFREGNNYNIGILSIPGLDDSILNDCNAIILGAISGSVTQCIAVFAATNFIAREFDGGYIKCIIMHGVKREVLYAKYVAVGFVGSLPITLASPLFVTISLMIKTCMIINFAEILPKLCLQALMMQSLTICFSAISLAIGGKGGSLIGLGVILTFPLIPSYVKLFSKGKIDISNWTLVSLLVNSGGAEELNTIGIIVTSLLTAVISFFLGCLVFCLKNYD